MLLPSLLLLLLPLLPSPSKQRTLSTGCSVNCFGREEADGQSAQTVQDNEVRSAKLQPARTICSASLFAPFSTMPQNEPENQKPAPPYPTNLRRVREEQAMITRTQLITRCEHLAAQDKTKYVTVSKTTLHGLEAGLRRPRLATAATLAAALESSVSELFPQGFENNVHNPRGNIEHILPAHRTGRPKKNS